MDLEGFRVNTLLKKEAIRAKLDQRIIDNGLTDENDDVR